VVKPDGYTSYLNCPNEKMSHMHEYKYAPMLKLLEKEYNCAGICEKPALYLFSNVDKGPPKELCKDTIIKLVETDRNTFVGFCFGAASIGLIGFILSLSVCYHKSNKLKNSWEQYQQMKFYWNKR